MPEPDVFPDVAPEAWAGVHRGPLREGEWVRLIDAKGRKHNFCLEAGKRFFSNRGHLEHDELIGRAEGVTVTSSRAASTSSSGRCCRDFVLSMPRGAAVVYPKDAAQIVAMADIFPGAHVVEAGVGSGALTCSLLRAVGADGRVSSYERREDFAEVARRNVDPFFGGRPPGLAAAPSATSPRSSPTSGERRPGRPRHARALGVPRRASRTALAARRRRLRVRRHHDPAVPDRRDAARARRLHRAAGLGVAGARLARRGSRRPPRAPDDRAHRRSWSPPAGWPTGTRRSAEAPAARSRAPTAPTTPGRGPPGYRPTPPDE